MLLSLLLLLLSLLLFLLSSPVDTSNGSLQVGENPHNTVFDVKRLIGRKVTEPAIREDMMHWPFKVRVRVRVSVGLVSLQSQG